MAVLLLFAIVGYLCFYGAVIKKDSAFFPVLFVSFVSIVEYFFGFAGRVDIGAYVIAGVGIVLIPVSVYKARRSILGTILSPTVLFMAVGIVWAYVITRGTGLSHSDDFNHWYRICKILYYDNTYPKTGEILYPSYVPGTACWNVFVTRFISFDVPDCFFAQSLINLSCCCSLISCLSKVSKISSKVILYIGVSLLSIMLCAFDISTYALLVDCTLGLLALSAAVYVIFAGKDLKWDDLAVLSVISTYTVLVKQSGLLMVLFVLLFLVRRNEVSVLKMRRYLLLMVAVPLLISGLYSIWGHIYYPDIATSSQALSLERFGSFAEVKTPQMVFNIICNTILLALPVLSDYPQPNALWVSFFLLLVFEYKKLKKFPSFVYVVGVLALYLVGLMGTYIFSMSNLEVSYMASYDRYYGTVAVYLAGLIFYMVFDYIASAETLPVRSVLATFVILTILTGIVLDPLYIRGYSFYHPREAFTDVAWKAICSYAPENTSYSDLTYAVVWDDEIVFDDGLYGTKVQQVAEVYLRSDHVQIYTFNYVGQIGLSEEDKKILEDADVLIVVGEIDDRLDPLKEFTASGTVVSGVNDLFLK